MKSLKFIIFVFFSHLILQAEELPRAVILPFESIGASEPETLIAKELFKVALIESGKYNVTEEPTDILEQPCGADAAKQVGEQPGVSHVFYGKLTKTDATCFFSISDLDVATGETKAYQTKFNDIGMIDVAAANVVLDITGVKTSEYIRSRPDTRADKKPAQPTPKSSGVTINTLLQQTTFMTQKEWEKAPVQEDIAFPKRGKTLHGHLSIDNDEDNLYLLLIVYDDDFYLGKDEGGVWADDRLFIVLDEKGDSRFTNGDEDRLSLFVRDFKGKPAHQTLRASHGDWYYENSEKKWEYSKEVRWEESHRSKVTAKEVNFFHTGPLEDGAVQDFAFEIKIPINSSDPYDLQSAPGDKINIGITYGNLSDGYSTFPPNSSPDSDPQNLLSYTLRIP